MVNQAREWEASGEYARAVECYMKITSSTIQDQNILEKCWMKVMMIDG
jgi:intraflagellar transport protein 172